MSESSKTFTITIDGVIYNAIVQKVTSPEEVMKAINVKSSILHPQVPKTTEENPILRGGITIGDSDPNSGTGIQLMSNSDDEDE